MISFLLSISPLVLALFHVVVQVCSQSCQVAISELQSERKVIILNSDKRSLKQPSNGKYSWKSGESIHFICGKDLKTLTCSPSSINAKRFDCAKPPDVTERDLNRECNGKSSKTFQMGFRASGGLFVPYYELCYLMDTCSVSHVKHRLLGASFGGVSGTREKSFQSFVCPGLRYNTHYTQASQKQPDPRFYFQRGHLFPDRDAPVFAWKLATYSYGNCVPQWNTINSEGGNWWTLEYLVFKYAQQTPNTEYTIYDGVLYDPRNKQYLAKQEKKIEIPVWFWKVVTNQTHVLKVFFVSHNLKGTKQTFCNTNRCVNDRAKGTKTVETWDFYNEASRGITHCCYWKDLARKNPLPIEVQREINNKKN
nr:putative salivary endonuclease [Culex quinquefasciatus]